MQCPRPQSAAGQPHKSDDLKKQELCNNCMKRSQNCPFCKSFSRGVSLEERRENKSILYSLKVNYDYRTNKMFLSVEYPLKEDALVIIRRSGLILPLQNICHFLTFQDFTMTEFNVLLNLLIECGQQVKLHQFVTQLN